MTKLQVGIVAKASIFAIAACGFALPLDAAPAGQQYVVSIVNMAYGTMPSGLKVGDSIVFVNKDSVPHTVTARDHSFDLRVGPGQRGRLSLTKAGTFQVYCIFHAPMRGTLIVSG